MGSFSTSSLHFTNAASFCAERSRLSQLPVGFLEVEWIGGGHPNQCFINAHSALSSAEMSIVSGWLVTPRSQDTLFAQHWWNYDNEKQKYVDRTPDVGSNPIYIADSEIALFVAEHNLKLKSGVCSSVLVNLGGYWLISMNNLHPVHVHDIKIETLFMNDWK